VSLPIKKKLALLLGDGTYYIVVLFVSDDSCLFLHISDNIETSLQSWYQGGTKISIQRGYGIRADD